MIKSDKNVVLHKVQKPISILLRLNSTQFLPTFADRYFGAPFSPFLQRPCLEIIDYRQVISLLSDNNPMVVLGAFSVVFHPYQQRIVHETILAEKFYIRLHGTEQSLFHSLHVIFF